MDRHSARRRCHRAIYVALIAFILANSVSAFAQTGPSMLYVPLLQSTNAGELGLALSNPTLTDTTVVLTARTYTGADDADQLGIPTAGFGFRDDRKEIAADSA